MDPNARLRKAVRGFYATLGAVLLAWSAPLVASSLAEHASLPARVGAVLIGTGGWIPMMLVVSAMIRLGDEYVRRMHLVAIACAFAGGLLLISLLDWLVRAGFIETPPLTIIWLAIAVLWAVSLFVTKHRFERQP